MIVSFIPLENGLSHTRRRVQLDITLNSVIVNSSIEAVFVGNRCGRGGSGCDVNILMRAIIIDKPGRLMCVKNIVPRTVGLWRVIGKMVVRWKIARRAVRPGGLSILDVREGRLSRSMCNTVDVVLEGGGLPADISILVLRFIQRGRIIGWFVLRVVIYDYNVALRIFD